MPAAARLHDCGAAGEGARQQHRVHGRQATARGESHAFAVGQPANKLGEIGLEGVDEPGLGAETVGKGSAKLRIDDVGVVAEDIGQMTLPEIEQTMAVLVSHPAAPGLDDARRERLDQADVMAAAVDLDLGRRLVNRRRSRRPAPVLVGELAQQGRIVSHSR